MYCYKENRWVLTWRKISFKSASCVIILLLITNTVIAPVEILCTTYIISLSLCTLVADRITACINQFMGIQADQEQRVVDQRLCWGQIIAKMLLSMEHDRGPLMFCSHTGSLGVDWSSCFCWTADTSQGHLELKRRNKGGLGTKVRDWE